MIATPSAPVAAVWRPHHGQQEYYLRSWAYEALFGGQAGPGKALAIDTPIPTPDGWIAIGDLQVGDCVFSGDGSPVAVTYAGPIMYQHEVYSVEFDDGSIILADGDHKWFTSTAGSRTSALAKSKRNPPKNPNLARPQTRVLDGVVTTREILETLRVPTQGNRANHAVYVAPPLQLPTQSLPIHPYVLGCWLGDGNSRNGSIFCVEDELLQHIRDCGYDLTQWGDKKTYNIVGIHKQLRLQNLFTNKHIPPIYLRASVEQRLNLLQGLMDTDGTIDKSGYCEFSVISKPLAQGVVELLASLGIKSKLREGRAALYGKDCGIRYRVGFTPHVQAFKLSRKAARQNTKLRSTQANRYIVDVKSVESVPVRCIEVDHPSHLYLAGRAMIPTHNTEVIVQEALRQVAHPLYTAIIFRRTFAQLEAANGIIQRSERWYPAYDGKYNSQKHYWTFPSGARIYFGHMEHDGDETQYDGTEFCYISFDELTHFTQKQYLYMFTRCRAPAPDLRAYIRPATNPGGIGHTWVKQRFITRDIVNRPRYFLTRMDSEGKWHDEQVPKGTPDALSRAFYPARLEDNPSADPAYRSRVLAMGDPVRIRQLLEGDWDAEYKEGLIYDTWSSTQNVTSEAEYNPDLPIYWGCDDGYVFGDGPGNINYHPRVILLVQDNPIGGFDVIDEYTTTGENHETSISNVLSRSYARPSICYVDSAAALFRGELHRFGLSTVPATHKVGEGIKSVRGMIVDGTGNRLLRVHPRCQHTIREFSAYRSDPKGRAESGEVVPLKVDDHCMDALRYLIYRRRHYRGST